MDLAGCFLTALQLGMSNLAPSACIFEAALLLFVFRNHLAYRHTPAFAIHRNERQVSGGYVLTLVLNVVFHPHLHPNFHRRAEHTINRRPQYDERPYVHRNEEVDMVD